MKNSRLLIVEDDEFLVLALKDNLEAEGCKIDVAGNGEEAMRHIHANTPDLILLDLLMPKRDGFYVLEEVRKNRQWKQIPIIVLSNVGYDSDIKKALEMGANEYFVKSQHMIVEVLLKINTYINKESKQQRPSSKEEEGVFRILDANGNFTNNQTKLRP